MKFLILSSNWKYRSKINQYDSSVLEDVDVLIVLPEQWRICMLFCMEQIYREV